MHNELLTAIFTRYRMYHSLIDYWQKSHEVYLKFPERAHLANCLKAKGFAEQMANAYWNEFVDAVCKLQKMVSYDPVMKWVIVEA